MWLPQFFFVDSNGPCKDLLFPCGPNPAQKPLYLVRTILKWLMGILRANASLLSNILLDDGNGYLIRGYQLKSQMETVMFNRKLVLERSPIEFRIPKTKTKPTDCLPIRLLSQSQHSKTKTKTKVIA